MSLHRIKYDGSATHRSAILHMVGQSVEVFKSEPTVAEIASWMNVHKVTARKHLDKMVERGELIKTIKPYRKNATIHTYKLEPYVKEQYECGVLKHSYEIYAQRVMKVILT